MTQESLQNCLVYRCIVMDYLTEDLKIIADYIVKKNICQSSIFITGGTGLIGSITAKAFLLANYKFGLNNKITVLVRDLKKAHCIFEGFKDINFIIGDITEKPSNCRFDYIIHTASPTTSKYYMTNPVEVMDSNYSGTKNILELAKISDSKSVVCLSSMEVFGVVGQSDKRLTEKELGYIDITNIRSCYSESKRVLELLCKCYFEEYRIPVKVARLAQTFGAGVLNSENRVFAQFARKAVNGEDIVLHTAGASVGNYCYTRDAIKAIITILADGQNGEAYTVVNEKSTMTIKEMAKLVADNFSGGKSKVVFDIPEGNKYGYAPETKIHLSAQKLKELGWEPEVDITEMYSRMIPYLS